MSGNERDMQITQIVTFGEGGRRYVVGGHGVVRFEEFRVYGQMAMVPWVRAVMEDGSHKEFNMAHLECVVREPIR